MARCTWKICRLFVCGLLGCCLTLAGTALAAEQKSAGAGPQPSEQEMMEAMTRLATPGPAHAALKALAGSWKTSVKAWTGPGDPMVSEGTSESALVLGGRFLKEEYHGSFMGQPFEGFGITGYDNAEKKYVSAWADTMGTRILVQSGEADPSGRVMTFHGTWEDPVTGKKSPTRMVTHVVDDNTHTFTMYSNYTGQEVKEMEITYTRR